MAGHSHSANIARRKGAVDQKRARVLQQVRAQLQSAVRQGGPDPDTNLKLRYAIEKARAVNMPKDNMERTIKRAVGEGAANIEELTYEGYAPGGVALMVTALTGQPPSHRGRPQVRVRARRRQHGHARLRRVPVPAALGVRVERGERSEEQLMELALEVGADDVRVEDQSATIYAPPTAFLDGEVGPREARAHVPVGRARLRAAEHGPRGRQEGRRQPLKLIDLLDANDDVQDVYANYEMPPEWLDELAAAGAAHGSRG
jgi:YebC/PmpR family DNA-binding regulatory protein